MPTIQEICAHRGVKAVMHFTRLENLSSILAKGLIPRDVCLTSGLGVAFNDEYRLDNTNAVCASIEFPNYKMFYRLQMANPGQEWVILVINAAILWNAKAAFCKTNAASKEVTQVPLEARMNCTSFEGLFAEYGVTPRKDLGIPDRFPTNPQAEVLLTEGIPRQYIMGAIVKTSALEQQLTAQHPGFRTLCRPGYFKPRVDFKSWPINNG